MVGNEDQHDHDHQANHSHVTIPISDDRVALMQRKMSDTPRLLSPAAGKPSCCIYRVPQSLAEVNGKVYNPHIISIGPFRRGDPALRMIEEHKWLYLSALVSRLGGPGKLAELLAAAAALERRARDCYAEVVALGSEDFAEMLVLDGCFILEVFRKAENLVDCEPDDPIFNMAWIVPHLYKDLLRLENQIPYFVLEKLFEMTEPPEEERKRGGRDDQPVTLSLLGLRFFNNAMQRPDEALRGYRDFRAKHLLDLVRMSFIPAQSPEPRRRARNTPTHIIHCVSKLRRSGIKLKQACGEMCGESFLTVRFHGGILEMPLIAIDDFTASLLQNCVAYEQCCAHCSKHFTTYATLLDCLINTYHDVEYLCDRSIIENFFGSDGEVARFINNLGKDVALDIEICYLADLFNDVHLYYRNSWHVHWAGFKYTYFDTPWSFISALAALVLLVLTIAQTFYTVYSYYH